jgi:hypothetical protein
VSIIDDDELIEMRCRACGYFLGWRKRSGRFIFWCSEDCAETPMAKYPETQERDEVVTELVLGGARVMAVAGFTDIPYQMVQQAVLRRKIDATATRRAS